MASATLIEVVSKAPGSSHPRSHLLVIENLLDLVWFESDAKQFNNTGNTLMTLVADIALKEDADYLAALNTYRDDSDLLRTCSFIYTYIYSRARHGDKIYFFAGRKVQKLPARLISSELRAHQMSPSGVTPH